MKDEKIRNIFGNPLPPGRRHQRGMALVMVMGVLSVTMLLVVHVMTVCETISKDAFVNARRSELRYQAESAADHAFWMHLTDRRLYPSRTLGASDESRVTDTDFEPWMADRRAHNLFDSNCQAYINTVEKTIRLDKTETLRTNVDVDDTETTEKIDDFLDILADYTDADSLVKLNGKEEDDYADEGLYAMPRDGDMQFKEEVYWLEGWADVITSEITIIPPSGKSFSSTQTKTSFFSASASEIQTTLDLSDEELATVLEARESWMRDSVTLEDSLSADLYSNIKANFSFTESNIAQYVVSAASQEGDIQVVYSNVREVDLSKSSVYADTNGEAFSIWVRNIQ